ncbi:cysteine-rich receptor-like protein kinase 10 [Cocos nucifera]|nr:cysteine-rich receptor-like protein kinase 10 [Cocos nucifera]
MKKRHREDINDATRKSSLLFDLPTVKEATSNFSSANRLGEGGFGTVYKGTLSDGQEIAVKRLSKSSGQGLEQLRNEVDFVAQLHHKNLNIIRGIARGLLYLHEDSRVRIIHRDLKAGNILLDSSMNPKISDFGLARLFGGDHTQSKTTKVVGTCGYMAPEYAIHGSISLKSDVFSFGVLVLEIVSGRRNNSFYDPGNVMNLLSYAWQCGTNGTAGGNHTQSKTTKVVGTFGYMAPEYAIHGSISLKLDVFSFGVLVLEIVSGRRNNSFYDPGNVMNLLSYAWQCWINGTALKLVDPSMGEHYSGHEMSKCINIGLLCVQENPSDRPNMSSVVLMLNRHKMKLQTPSQPAFLYANAMTESYGFVEDAGPYRGRHEQSTSTSTLFSSNEVSITELDPR